MRFVAVVLAISVSISASSQTESTGGYSVDGYVVDQQGTPLANTTVRLERVGVGQRFEAKTDSKGNYFHISLPGREYLLSITKGGHVFTLGARLGVEETVMSADGISEI